MADQQDTKEDYKRDNECVNSMQSGYRCEVQQLQQQNNNNNSVNLVEAIPLCLKYNIKRKYVLRLSQISFYCIVSNVGNKFHHISGPIVIEISICKFYKQWPVDGLVRLKIVTSI